MTTYEFQATLHRNLAEMLNHVAEAWITADGDADAEFVRSVLAEQTDEELAREAIDNWGLDQVADMPDEGSLSHMARADYTVEQLAEAFGRYRQSLTAQTLDALIAETYVPDETGYIVLCDTGSGSAHGEEGTAVIWGATMSTAHGHLLMHPTEPHMSADRVETVWASEWQGDPRGYRYQIRF